MENRFYDEKNGLWYEKQGDYYLPCISLPEEETQPIGVWGQRHLRYLKQHRKVLYTNLLTSGKLNSHLAELNKQAEDMFFRVVKQLAEKEGVTEKLKAENQMEWIGRMNNIRARATENMANNFLRVLDLTITQCTVLYRLIENKAYEREPLNQRDLESYMCMSNPAVAGVISRLEEKGLIQRIKDNGDKRYNYIIPTEKGMQLKDDIVAFIIESEEKLLHNFSEDEKNMLWQFIARMQNNLENC